MKKIWDFFGTDRRGNDDIYSFYEDGTIGHTRDSYHKVGTEEKISASEIPTNIRSKIMEEVPDEHKNSIVNILYTKK